MTISLLRKSEICQSVPMRWATQYSSYPEQDWKSRVTRELAALCFDERTPARINAIIGNDSWTTNKCDECEKDYDVLVRIGDEPDYDARRLDICHDCLSKAADMAKPNP